MTIKIITRVARCVAAVGIAALPLAIAEQAHAINQDHHGGTGVTVPIPSTSPLNCHNYPKDDPGCEVPSSGSIGGQGDGLEATPVALGALGGIALAGAGLGITLGVQRRHDHAAPHTA
jgi:hypothetical protein